MGYSNFNLYPPVEEPWNVQERGALTLEFPGKEGINLGISWIGGIGHWNFQGREVESA